MKLDTLLHVLLGDSVPYIKTMLQAQLVPMLHGSPAIGKSAAIHMVAKELNLMVIDARFAGYDPTDLNGFPSIDHEKGIAAYYPMETFPLDDWTVPEGYSGWLVFCDELTSAPPAVQAASYKLFLDRMVGQRSLHEKAYLAGAGNLEEDGAIVQPMSSALVSRLGHLMVLPDFEFFMKWAERGGLGTLITSFLRYMPGSYYTFNNEEPDVPYASPRTWEFVHKYLVAYGGGQRYGDCRTQLIPMASFVNLAPAQDLISFTNTWASLPQKADVLANPESAKVPGYDQPGALHALAGAVGEWLQPDNADKLFKYIDRIPSDFQTILLRNAVRRKRNLLDSPRVFQWVQENADVIL